MTPNQSAWKNYNALRPTLGAIYEMPSEPEYTTTRWRKDAVRGTPPPLQPADAPLPGELTQRQWIEQECKRSGKTFHTVRQYLNQGKYDDRIQIRRLTKYLVFITPTTAKGRA